VKAFIHAVSSTGPIFRGLRQGRARRRTVRASSAASRIRRPRRRTARTNGFVGAEPNALANQSPTPPHRSEDSERDAPSPNSMRDRPFRPAAALPPDRPGARSHPNAAARWRLATRRVCRGRLRIDGGPIAGLLPWRSDDGSTVVASSASIHAASSRHSRHASPCSSISR